MVLSVITPQIIEEFGVSTSSGIIILSVERTSPMYNFGFRAGDVIIQVENDTISSIVDVKKALLRNGTKRVFVNRYGKIGIITVK